MKIQLFLLLFAVSLPATSSAQSKTYILIHGGWHGAWCWKKVVTLLEAKGNRVLAIDLPSHGEDKTPATTVTLDDYVQKVIAVANAQTGSVILIGHSMAGVVIAQASEALGKEKVAKLVFLDAFMPRNGESVLALAEQAAAHKQVTNQRESAPSLAESLVFSDDKKACMIQETNVVHLFYQDCSAEDIAFAKARIGWESMACLATPVRLTEARYGVVPKAYILCTEANDLDKSSLAQHIPCQKVYKLASGHSPFFSMPEKLVKILLEQ